MTRGTIKTSFHKHHEGLRVRFSCPADGYNLDDLDAFRVVIDHARRKILEQQPTTPQNILPTPDDTAAFTEQRPAWPCPLEATARGRSASLLCFSSGNVLCDPIRSLLLPTCTAATADAEEVPF